MTPEQRNEIIKLASAWSLASFMRGNDQGRTQELAEADRDALKAFFDYAMELTK